MTLDDLLILKSQQSRPIKVCLCGSTRFSQAFQDANLFETLAGRIVLSIWCNTKSDEELAKAGVEINKDALDTLHLFKIDEADEVLILNVGGYIGESTYREVEYARLKNKRIRWLEPDKLCYCCQKSATDEQAYIIRSYRMCTSCKDALKTWLEDDLRDIDRIKENGMSWEIKGRKLQVKGD